MPPQAAAAPLQDPSQEVLPKQEAAVELAKPAKAIEMAVRRLESMLEKGDTNGVKKMIKSMTEAAATGMHALQEFPEETQAALMEAAPEEMKALSEAQAASQIKLEMAEQTLLKDLGTQEAANDAVPAAVVEEVPMVAPVAAKMPEIKPVEVPAPVAVEAVKVMPIMKVGEVPAPVQEAEADAVVEKNEMAEQQKMEAEEVMKEDLTALQNFVKEHHLNLDPNTLNIPENELQGLMPLERSYVAVLQAKYHAGDASHAHAEALMAVAGEQDPEKKKALAAQALELSDVAMLKEKAATILNGQYMNMPEIIALAGGGVGGDNTGGSYGGNAFEPANSPFGGEPKPPMGPPNHSAANMYSGGGTPGDGIAKVEAYKTPDAKVTKKPSFIDRWFRRNVSDVTYGGVDSTKSNRE